MAEAVINKGVYGDQRSAAAGQGAKDAIAGVVDDLDKSKTSRIERQEREYITSERERVAAERIYNREEDFYIANEVTDAGLGFTDEIQSLLMKKKAKHGKIAGLGYKATDEQRAELRAFSANVKSISGAQEHLKTVIGNYKTELAENGGVSTGMDADIAALFSDLSAGKGDFKPVEGENGEIRFEGQTTLGCGADGKPSDTDMTQPCNINYSYDQLKTLAFSPKYDLKKSLKADGDLLGSKETEILLKAGGSYTDKNSSELLRPAATQLAESTIIPTKLNEIAAELGYPAGKRKARVKEIGKEAFREEIVGLYAQRLIDQKDSSRSYDGNLSEKDQHLIDNPTAKSGAQKWRPDQVADFKANVERLQSAFAGDIGPGGVAGPEKINADTLNILQTTFPDIIKKIEVRPATDAKSNLIGPDDPAKPLRIRYKPKLGGPWVSLDARNINDLINAFGKLGDVPQVYIDKFTGQTSSTYDWQTILKNTP